MKHRMLITPMREGGYHVTFPGIKGCITDGETLEEAIVNAKDVIGCWVDADCPLPDPEYWEDVGESHSCVIEQVKKVLMEYVVERAKEAHEATSNKESVIAKLKESVVLDVAERLAREVDGWISKTKIIF